MVSRNIIQIFDHYQRERLAFVQSVADLALRPQNVDMLQQAGALDLLRPLLKDVCPQIQQSAAIAIGRLAHSSANVSKNVLNLDLLPVLLSNIENQNKNYKKSVLFVIRAICKHDPDMAEVVCTTGGLEALIVCLEDFEPTVKEGAAWAIGYIARHSQNLAQMCVDAGAIPLLTLCLQEPELTLKQIAINALADIAKHSVDLAQSVVDVGAIPHFAKSLNNQDEKLKKLVLTAMSNCARHSSELAEVVVEAEVFPTVLLHLGHACPQVRKSAGALVRDIVKHSLELTQLVVNTGGIGALIEVLHQTDKDSKEYQIPCITALGYIAGHSDQLAMSVLGCKAVIELTQILHESTDDSTLAVVAWTLGQIGKHTPEHANAVAAANALPRLIQLYEDQSSSEDLKFKCKTTLKQVLQKCLLMSALEPLLYSASLGIVKYVLGQFSKVLPNDPKARRLFVTSGCLKKVQEIVAEPGSTLMEYITLINACFPEEIVRYYSPGYCESLLNKVEEYSPQMMTIFREVGTKESDMQTDIEVYLDKTSPSPSQELAGT